jgi:hypothetical protein
VVRRRFGSARRRDRREHIRVSLPPAQGREERLSDVFKEAAQDAEERAIRQASKGRRRRALPRALSG